MTTVHILTAVHNDLGNLKQLLQSIQAQSIDSYTVTVVDDGSTDGTREYLQKNHPEVYLVHGNGSLWWTGSINSGITNIYKYSVDSDYLLTINNDCTIPRDYLAKILKLAKPKRIVGSRVISEQTGKTWDLGEMIDWSKGQITQRKRETDPLDSVTTKGTLYPLSMFKHIGLLSKRLPHYLSDYEISIRAKHHGYQLVLATDCVVTNNTLSTGYGDMIPNKMTIRDGLKLLFSRKSKLNIIDQFWFITLSCPTRYKIINYWRLFQKIFKGYNRIL